MMGVVDIVFFSSWILVFAIFFGLSYSHEFNLVSFLICKDKCQKLLCSQIRMSSQALASLLLISLFHPSKWFDKLI